MQTFEEFMVQAWERGEAINTVFEERLFRLVAVLERIVSALDEARYPYALVGGLAVLVHVEEADPEYSTLTRDVDLMVDRADLDRIREAAASVGLRYRHAAGVDMLLPDTDDRRANAIHLVFTGERVRPTYPTSNPPINPVVKSINGVNVQIVAVSDLLRMKLNSNRDKDRVHVRSMDAAGLITAEVERTLPNELAARLRRVRETE